MIAAPVTQDGPAATTTVTLREWQTSRVRGLIPWWDEPVHPDDVVATGIAAADLASCAAALTAEPIVYGAAPNWVMKALHRIATWTWSWGDLPVRDGVGWALVAAHTGREDPTSLIYGWEQTHPDLLRTGWRFAAAGLTPREARAVVESGSPDWAALSVMAALRGCPIPAGDDGPA